MLSLLLVDPLNLDYRNGKEGEEIKGKRTWVETEKLREEKAVCSVDTLLPNKSYFQNGKRSEEFVGPVLLKIGCKGRGACETKEGKSEECGGESRALWVGAQIPPASGPRTCLPALGGRSSGGQGTAGPRRHGARPQPQGVGTHPGCR